MKQEIACRSKNVRQSNHLDLTNNSQRVTLLRHNGEHMKRIFEIGDLVMLTTDTYMDLKKGTLGIVTRPITIRSALINVWIDGAEWSFNQHEFTHVCNIKETK